MPSDAIAKPESFSLLYLNPPTIPKSVRWRTTAWSAVPRSHYHWLAMNGVLAMVIPFERLMDCAGLLSSHFTALNVFRMTDEESVRFRQIAVLGLRSNIRGSAIDANKRLLQRIGPTAAIRSCQSWRPMPASPIKSLLQTKRRSVIVACPTTCLRPANALRRVEQVMRFLLRMKKWQPGGRLRLCMEAMSGCYARRAC